MAEFLSTKVDISPTADATWRTVDLSSYVPTGTTGIIVRMINSDSGTQSLGIRHPSSSDEHYYVMSALNQANIFIGINASREVEIKLSDSTCYAILEGYFTSDAVFFEDSVDVSPTASSWTDVDCSSDVPEGAVFGIFIGKTTTRNTDVNMRAKTGSPDARTPASNNRYCGYICPLDGSRIAQRLTSSYTTSSLFLIGYLTVGTAKVNASDVSIGTADSYIDIDMTSDSPPANATGVIVEVFASNFVWSFDLKEKGQTGDYYHVIDRHAGFFAVGIDTDDILQNKVSNLGVDCYVWGYLESVPAAIDLLDGTIQIKDDAIKLLDGTVNVQDITIDILDGTVQVQDIATDIVDGTVVISDLAVDLLDGTVLVSNTATDLLDGTVVVKDLVIKVVDGTVEVISTGTAVDLLDGTVTVQDIATSLLDGTVQVSNATISLLDGTVTVKDTTISIVDGTIKIGTLATDLLDGTVVVKNISISLLDGTLNIEDTITIILDGTVLVSDGTTQVVVDGKVVIQTIEVSEEVNLSGYINTSVSVTSKIQSSITEKSYLYMEEV